jgi:hypothetical protein
MFVAFVLPSDGQIFAIYYTLFELCYIKPLGGRTNATKNKKIFGLNPSPAM